MTLGSKIITAAIVAVLLTITVGLLIQKRAIERQGIELISDTMRATIIEAENVRESISALGEKGTFDRTKLLAQFRAGGDLRNSTIYSTILVVAARNAAQKPAADQAFDFGVPKHRARNPKNTPTADQAAILDAFEKSGLAEYFRADRATGTILYAGPIKLPHDCPACDGDPANSPTHDGKDFVGFAMENWRVGEVHGAFVLKTDFRRVDTSVRRAMFSNFGRMNVVAVVIVGGFFVMNQRLIVRPLRVAITVIGATGMRAMKGAMSDIKASSDTIAKIINTINEIALQTNILALNRLIGGGAGASPGAGK